MSKALFWVLTPLIILAVVGVSVFIVYEEFSKTNNTTTVATTMSTIMNTTQSMMNVTQGT